eukprot:COSAG02_NODE_3944_length_6003_cov_3.206978_6_plen_136_part_00
MTERAYVANLRNLYELYYKRLHLACYFPKDHPQRFLELDVVMRMFSNIEDLVLINEELLDALERNAASEASQVDRALQIGAIFHKMAFALILCTCFRSSRNAPLIRVSHLDVLLWNGVGPQIGSTSQTITQLTAR